MKKIIEMKNGIPMITNHQLSEGFGIKIRAMNNLIIDNIDDLNLYGDLEKVIGGISNTTNRTRGGNNKVTYFLNEQQAMLIMTYTRKNEKTRKFRIDLINAFSKLKIESQNISGLLLEAQRLMKDYQLKGKDWSSFGRELKIRKPLIACALKDAEKLAQIELGI